MRGPGIVLGQDGQQIFIKHSSIYVRCHVILKRNHTSNEENISESWVEAGYKEKGKYYSSLNSNEHDDAFVEPESDEEVKSESHGYVPQEMNTIEDQPESEHPENNPGTLPSSTESAQCIGAADNGSSANTVITKNLSVKYKLKNSDYFKKAMIFCRVGESIGKYGNCWNIQNESEEGFNYIDFDKDVDEWYPREKTEQSSQEVFLNFPVDQIT